MIKTKHKWEFAQNVIFKKKKQQKNKIRPHVIINTKKLINADIQSL